MSIINPGDCEVPSVVVAIDKKVKKSSAWITTLVSIGHRAFGMNPQVSRGIRDLWASDMLLPKTESEYWEKNSSRVRRDEIISRPT